MSLYFTTSRPFLSKNCPLPWGIWTPSNTWFLCPTRVLNPNGISIGFAVFAGLTSVTDRQTDHATRSVTLDRIYVRSTAMRRNKVKDLLVIKAPGHYLPMLFFSNKIYTGSRLNLIKWWTAKQIHVHRLCLHNK